MDPATILQKFKTREFNPKLGRAERTLDQYTSIEEVVTAFKNQEELNAYQLISRILYLTGVPKEKAMLAVLSLFNFISGHLVRNPTLDLDFPIGMITIACGHHKDYDDLVPPLPVISLDQGQTWLGFEGNEVEVYSFKTWIMRRYHELFNLMTLYPNENHYKHDFRTWAIYEPAVSGFKIMPGSLHRIGLRHIADDVKQIKQIIHVLEKADCVKPVIVPPLPFNTPQLRNKKTGEPPTKKMRKE